MRTFTGIRLRENEFNETLRVSTGIRCIIFTGKNEVNEGLRTFIGLGGINGKN